MKYLLDTHTFLWWNVDDPQLSSIAKEIISDGDNEIFLNAASASQGMVCRKRVRQSRLKTQFVVERCY
jgi:PIN domain nuclease of toxin-antitoxin system